MKNTDDDLLVNLFALDEEGIDCYVPVLNTCPDEAKKSAEIRISAMFSPISATKYSDLTPSSMISHKI